MSAEDLEKYETEMELQLYREYRDVVGLFTYVVETERRFYLTNNVDLQVQSAEGEVYFEVTMSDAWVWDMYRPARFVKNVKVVSVQGRQRGGAGQVRSRGARRQGRLQDVEPRPRASMRGEAPISGRSRDPRAVCTARPSACPQPPVVHRCSSGAGLGPSPREARAGR